MADLAGLIHEFEASGPIANHAAHQAYLDNAEQLLERAALMIRVDAEMASTYLRNRRPKKGRRLPWSERLRLSRRTRAHGRHAGDALVEAAKAIRKWRIVHQEFIDKEKKARRTNG
ncbi:hypothetical protein [Streptosporangium sp. NPDC051022]|uniref:hypothetical protein n=1 Tax=Streptosporangium sp. NPDC051022 TaxID=3155752 RepID=UPI0034368768